MGQTVSSRIEHNIKLMKYSRCKDQHIRRKHTLRSCMSLPEGERQSPINIVTKDAEFDTDLVSAPLIALYRSEKDLEISNTGHSVKVQFEQKLVLHGGPLDGNYRLEQFHLHWGSSNDRGAEHTVNGRIYSAELHLVHWNCEKYASFTDAANKPDGLAVIGLLIQVGEEHKGFKTITDCMYNVRKADSQYRLTDHFDPRCLLPRDISQYWTYHGSLTTPPFYESVTWILLNTIMDISQEQMNILRSLQNNDGICITDNYRAPDPMNSRCVHASFSSEAKV